MDAWPTTLKAGLSADQTLVRKLMYSLDLTEYEVRAYLALIQHGQLTVRRISELGGIPRPKCYDVLRSLQSKGLIAHILTRPIRYQPLPIKAAFNNRVLQLRRELERKEREAEELVEELERRLWGETQRREFKVVCFEGRESIAAATMADAANARGEILVAISREPAEYGWTEHLDELRQALERGVTFRFLIHRASRFLERARRVGEVDRYLRQGNILVRCNDTIHQPFAVIADSVSYIFLTDPERREFLMAIRIEDPVFARHMKAIFEVLWRQAELVVGA